jgi:hypothetical protein
VLIAAGGEACAVVDRAGADVCAGPPGELLPELHAAAAAVKAAPAASAGMIFRAWPVRREVCW